MDRSPSFASEEFVQVYLIDILLSLSQNKDVEKQLFKYCSILVKRTTKKWFIRRRIYPVL